MAILIERERLVRLSKVPAYLRRRGAVVSMRTVQNWVKAGTLEAVTLGSVPYTSRQALQRHADRGRAENERPAVDRAANEAAGLELKAMGA